MGPIKNNPAWCCFGRTFPSPSQEWFTRLLRDSTQWWQILWRKIYTGNEVRKKKEEEVDGENNLRCIWNGGWERTPCWRVYCKIPERRMVGGLELYRELHPWPPVSSKHPWVGGRETTDWLITLKSFPRYRFSPDNFLLLWIHVTWVSPSPVKIFFEDFAIKKLQ